MKNNNQTIGALWQKKSKDGIEYFSGNLDLGPLFQKINIVIFRNEKNKDTQPDYRILLSQQQTKDKSGEEGIPF